MEAQLYNPTQIQTMIDETVRNRDLFEQLLDEHSAPAMPAMPTYSLSRGNSLTQLEEEEKKQTPAHQGCKCTKIDCLKLYCECFARGRTCNQNCICTCCGNKEGKHQQIYLAKQIANYRNPGFFKNVPAFVPMRKCTCKKSQCRKKYCQCYSAGLKCTEQCECLGCQNGKCQHKDHDGMYSMGIQVHA